MLKHDIEGMFGSGFTQAVAALPPGRWAGPITSTYGAHLVRVDERQQQEPLPFEEVRENLREEWQAARIQELRDQGLPERSASAIGDGRDAAAGRDRGRPATQAP